MSYVHLVAIVSGIGFFAALTFFFLYVAIDRPTFRDRYAGLLAGLGLVSTIGFGVPFALSLFGTPISEEDGRPVWQWFISIGIRGLASAFMCWLLWVYLTPNRARNRLGRYSPNHQEEHRDAPGGKMVEG